MSDATAATVLGSAGIRPPPTAPHVGPTLLDLVDEQEATDGDTDRVTRSDDRATHNRIARPWPDDPHGWPGQRRTTRSIDRSGS